MRREKERQLRRRRRQKMLIKRCVAVAACVAVVLLCISAVWAVVKPMVKNSDTSGKTDKAVMEVEAGTAEGAEDGETEDGNAADSGNAGGNESGGDASDETAAGADTQAVKTKMAADTVTSYAVPGWQVDDNGWWYANEDRTYYKNGWLQIDGQDYYFNADGYMQTGWAVIGNKGCYFNENGVYEPDKESKMIALTFDDGPGKYTSELLDILEANGARATFFMLGECVSESHSTQAVMWRPWQGRRSVLRTRRSPERSVSRAFTGVWIRLTGRRKMSIPISRQFSIMYRMVKSC